MAQQSFSQLVKGNTPVLVDFYADWCGPCKMMKPILEELKSKLGDNVKIVKIDVDRNPQIAQQFRIQGVPTLMIFRNGQSLWRQSGVVQANQLAKIIQQHSN